MYSCVIDPTYPTVISFTKSPNRAMGHSELITQPRQILFNLGFQAGAFGKLLAKLFG